MRRHLPSIPAFIFTFLFAFLAFSFFGYRTGVISRGEAPRRHEITELTRHYEIILERIDVRNSDRSQWNSNSGYLGMYDSVYLGESRILALYLQDGMRISHDSGKTSQRIFEPSGLPKATGGFTVNDLEFLDSNTGWASGSVLIETRDGGHSWQNVELPEWMDNLRVKFIDANVGFVAGRAGFRGNTSLAVYRTTDGGRTWRKSFRTREIDTPWEIVFVDEKVVIMIGAGGWLWRTSDGGKSWKSILKRDFGRVMSLSRSPDGRFWLFGKNSIRYSEDLGVTWKVPRNLDDSVINHEWWSVDFTESGIGVAVSEDAAIALTRDGGETWRKVNSNLHIQDVVPVQDNPYTEALRGIQLNGNEGIIQGSQRDYRITLTH